MGYGFATALDPASAVTDEKPAAARYLLASHPAVVSSADGIN